MKFERWRWRAPLDKTFWVVEQDVLELSIDWASIDWASEYANRVLCCPTLISFLKLIGTNTHRIVLVSDIPDLELSGALQDLSSDWRSNWNTIDTLMLQVHRFIWRDVRRQRTSSRRAARLDMRRGTFGSSGGSRSRAVPWLAQSAVIHS